MLQRRQLDVRASTSSPDRPWTSFERARWAPRHVGVHRRRGRAGSRRAAGSADSRRDHHRRARFGSVERCRCRLPGAPGGRPGARQDGGACPDQRGDHGSMGSTRGRLPCRWCPPVGQAHGRVDRRGRGRPRLAGRDLGRRLRPDGGSTSSTARPKGAGGPQLREVRMGGDGVVVGPRLGRIRATRSRLTAPGRRCAPAPRWTATAARRGPRRPRPSLPPATVSTAAPSGSSCGRRAGS